LSGGALVKEPKQLASQMVGRLHSIIAQDIPTKFTLKFDIISEMKIFTTIFQ
jgi:hypothetical protein